MARDCGGAPRQRARRSRVRRRHRHAGARRTAGGHSHRFTCERGTAVEQRLAVLLDLERYTGRYGAPPHQLFLEGVSISEMRHPCVRQHVMDGPMIVPAAKDLPLICGLTFRRTCASWRTKKVCGEGGCQLDGPREDRPSRRIRSPSPSRPEQNSLRSTIRVHRRQHLGGLLN